MWKSLSALERSVKRLPVGKQVFRDLIEGDFVYVDKTKYLLELIEIGTPLFLSRPRRFGKSLTVSTFKELFTGNRELFRNTYAFDNWDFGKTYPVISLDLSIVSASDIKDMKAKISYLLHSIAENYGITLYDTSIPELLFQDLIRQLSEKGKVVLLIDEYDAPILDSLHKENLPEVKDILRNFYKVIKTCEEYLHFIFITGISKFSKIGVFSSLNNLEDVSLYDSYAEVLGYTREEIKVCFSDYINAALVKLDLSEEKFWEKLKHYYNGYSWNGEQFVYNPFSVLRFFRECKFYPYWMESGSPSYIISYVEKNQLRLDKLENKIVEPDFMSRREIDLASPESFMTQAGYLTIKEIDKYGDYILNFPNYEVFHTFNALLIESQYKVDNDDVMGVKRAVRRALIENDTKALLEQLKVLFSSVPYIHFDNNRNEHFYHSLLLMFLRACGFDLLSEEISNMGRSDISLFWQDHVYIIELKVAGHARAALKQIEDKNYAGKYRNKKVVAVGLKIDFDERNIVDWEIKELSSE